METKNLIVFLSVALYLIVLADASHFRSAITRFTTDSGDPLKVTFDLEFAYRRSYGASAYRNYANPDNNLLPGDTLSYQSWTFGQGRGSTTSHFLISTANLEEDWLLGRFLVDHTYPSFLSGSSWWTAFMQSCCRIGSLRNAANASYRVEMSFDLTPRTINGQTRGNNSPVVGTNPLLRISNGEVFVYKIIAFDPDNDPITYSFGTSSQCGSGHFQPGGLALEPSTGVITWDVRNVALGLWNVCLRLSDGFSEIPLDFLIEVRESVNVCDPHCELDGAICETPNDCGECSQDETCVPNGHPFFLSPPTPIEGAEIDALVDQEIVITVVAEDPNSNDVVTIAESVVPPGATLEPQQGDNPASRVFRWTPTHETNEVVCFAAQDQHGLGIVGGQQCFSIRVIDEIVRCEDPLGEARGFGIFASDNIDWEYGSFEGRVIAGGNINLNFVTVGCNLYTNLAPVDADGCTTATCADIAAADGFEDTLIAGGNINAVGSTSVATGHATYGGSSSGSIGTASGCDVRQGTPVNTAEIAQFFKDLSQVNSATHPTSYYIQYDGGKTSFIATGAEDVDIFHIRADVLLIATEIEVVGAHPNATMIFNVNGPNEYTIGNLGWNNVNSNKAVWNFYEATGVTFDSVDWRGTVLAPYANFTSTNGAVNGQVFAKSLVCSGTSCSNIRYTDAVKFDGCIPVRVDGGSPVPLPEHPCAATYQCEEKNNNSICENGGCRCIDGATGDYPDECHCDSPSQIIWVDGKKICLTPPDCTDDWQCNTGVGETCEKEQGVSVGICVFKCSANWQCDFLTAPGPASFAVCNSDTEECECMEGADVNADGLCACDPPKFFAWSGMGQMYCLSPNQCFYDWQCAGTCTSDGTAPGECE